MHKFLLPALALAALTAPALAATDVPLGHFRSVELSGGGHVTFRNGATQRVTLIKGSDKISRFTVRPNGQLEIHACNDNCPAQYDLDVEIVSPDANGLAVNGGGRIDAQGSFTARSTLDVAILGGGSINARAIPADKVNAAVKGGGNIQVAPASKLNAAIAGGGKITYWGNPAVTQAVVGGGEVSRGG
jgi:Putative auto-transporter adhesin, head GIN domain